MWLYFIDRRRVRCILLLVLPAVCLFWAVIHFAAGVETVSHSQPIYQGSGRHREVAFTVNVFWGEVYIPQMLDALRRKNVKATFFLGGTWVQKYPELAALIVREGHEIGSHGYSHPHPDRLSKYDNLREIQKAEEIIYKATGKRPCLFSPPYGERGASVLQAAGEASYTTILWSVDTVDWQLPPPEVIVQRVTGKVHNGAIILMHPTAPTVKALPVIIDSLEREGYRLVTVSKLLEGLEFTDSGVRGPRLTI